MSGAGTASGVDYQGHAFACVAVHVLAGRFLPWFQDVDDVPVAIRMERGGPGDDLRVTMRSGRVIEVQAKHNATGGDDFTDSAVRLIDGLQADPDLRGVLLVNTGRTTMTVRVDFEADRIRLVDGDPFTPRTVMKKVLARLSRPFEPTVMKRLRLIELNLDEGSMGEDTAQKMLAPLLTDERRVIEAWTLLGRQGVRAAAKKRHYDRNALLELLEPFGLRATKDHSAQFEAYLDWAIETNATFLLAPLPEVRLDSFHAWDELAPVADGDVAPSADSDAIRRYHAWEERRDHVSVRDRCDASQLLEGKQSAIIIGGAGSGKSTLTRRLVREACEGGMVAMRVSLKQIRLAMDSGKPFDDALAEAAFQGSPVEAMADRRKLLAGATFIIADGLDETDPARVLVAERLRDWVNGHPDVAVIVTTRPVAHSAGLLPGLRTLELMPLHDGGISKLTREIFTAALRDPDRVESALEAFEVELQMNRGAAAAARNPMLLSCMVALALEGRALPKGRAALFAEVIDLLRRTPPHGRTPSVEKIDARVARRVVDAAGWILSEAPTTTRDELAERIAEWLERDGLVSASASATAADTALMFWEERRLFERLRSGTREYVTFVHLNLGEHAAARRVSTMTAPDLAAWLTAVRRLPQWRQVILLAAESGAAEQIAAILLDLDDPRDRESREAFLAAECLQELDTPDATLVEKTVDAMVARFDGDNAPEAGETLVAMARFARHKVARVSLSLLDDPSPLMRLIGQAGVFAGNPALLPNGLPRKFLDEYLPIQHIYLKGTRPEQMSPLPVEAEELQLRTAALAVDALFRTTEREAAMKIARSFVDRHALLPLLTRLWAPLQRHDAANILTAYYERTFRSVFPPSDKIKYRDEMLSILDAVAASVGPPEPKEDASKDTLPLLSRVLSALHFWDVGFDGISRSKDQQAVNYVIHRVLRGIRIDREALRCELASAYRIAKALTPRGMLPYVRRVAIHVDWRTAASEPVDPGLLREALVHPARAIVFAAAQLLEVGGAGPSAHNVIYQALATGGRVTGFVLAQVAAEAIGVEAAVRLIRERLSDGTARPQAVSGIYEGLKFAPVAVCQALVNEILSGAADVNAVVANEAISVLAVLNTPARTSTLPPSEAHMKSGGSASLMSRGRR